jgi:hypothetical protein
MKRLVWMALCLTVSAALAATKPLYVTPADPLSVNQTFPGFIEVHGTWALTSDLNGDYAKTFDRGILNSITINCYQGMKLCYEAIGWVDGEGKLKTELTNYDVIEWTDSEITAKGSDLCDTYELTIAPKSEEVTKMIRAGGSAPAAACQKRAQNKKLSTPIVMKLMGPNDAAINDLMRKKK